MKLFAIDQHLSTSILAFFMIWTSHAQINFLPDPDPNFYPQRTIVSTITANTGYQGYGETQAYFGQGEYEIFLDNVDGVLDRPIIVLDGFDPSDSRDIGTIYATLSYDGQNLADELRNLGFDIVILNAPNYTTNDYEIKGGGDFIQRNAMVLIALIQEINDQKEGNEELVVLGPSMGGLISRYALAYMEQEGLTHETRLYLSIDSPHRGANIPISLQYLMNYLAVLTDDPIVQEAVDFVLNSAAAKQMLQDHLLGHLLEGSDVDQDPNSLLPIGAPNFRNEFQQELNDLGFPQQVRNVTMINGAIDGTTIGSPGMVVVDTSIEIDALTDIEIVLNFTPSAGQNITVTDASSLFVGIPISSFSADAESPATSDGVDSAPGGTGNISEALAGADNPLLQEFIDALNQDEYSFIPTMSALAIETDNWHGTADLNSSPFDNIEASTINSGHVSLTQDMADFAITEIIGTLGIAEVTRKPWVRILNPAQGGIDILLESTNRNIPLTAQLYQLDGRLIVKRTWVSPSERLFWPQSISKGVYILRLNSGIYSQHLRVLIH